MKKKCEDERRDEQTTKSKKREKVNCARRDGMC